MTSFSKLKNFAATAEKTVWYETGLSLGSKDGKIVELELLVAHAGQGNQDYLNVVARRSAMKAQAKGGRSGKRLRQVGPGAKREEDLSVEQLAAKTLAEQAESRNDDREDYPGTVIRGWRGAFDDEGKETEFTVANCRDLLSFMTDEVFDPLRVFVNQLGNFLPVADPEQLAKN